MDDVNRTMATSAVAAGLPMFGFEMATAVSRATMHAMSEWNREMSRFIGHRLEQDAELQDRLARCDNPGQLFECCSSFMQQAFEEYADEFRRLQQLSAEAASENMSALDRARA